ncbi:hypothetical protein P3T20_005095 [Paraburkholderia sp. GAS206C]|uniref:hypothetical protein n=1 Tax=unclassified Paraburkholderia TaxID=2615204 RepID=UPI003D1AF0B7
MCEDEYLKLVEGIPSDRLKGGSCVLLINSRAEGFSNSTSDIDFMVIVEDSPLTEEWSQFSVAGHVIDVYFVAWEILRDRIDIENNRKLHPQRIDFLHKVRTAIPIVGQNVWGGYIRDVKWALFDEALVDLCSFECVLSSEDLIGSVCEGDFETAALTGQVLMGYALDGLLAARAESQPRQKWRLKKARKTFGSASPLVAEYVSLQFSRGLETKEWMRWIDDIFNFVRKIQAFTFFPDLARCVGDLEPIAFNKSLLCDRFTLCNRRDGKYIFYVGKPFMGSSKNVALIFSFALFSNSIDDLVTLGLRYGKLAGHAIREEDLRKVAALLIKSGILRESAKNHA